MFLTLPTSIRALFVSFDKIANWFLTFLTQFLDSNREHSGDITKISLITKDGTIASAAKDKEIKFWFPPKTWKKEVAPANPNAQISVKPDIVLSDSSSHEEEKKKKKKDKKKKDKKKKHKKKAKKSEKVASKENSSESEDDELETPTMNDANQTSETKVEEAEKNESSSSEGNTSDHEEIPNSHPEDEEIPNSHPEEEVTHSEPKEEVNTEPDTDKKNVFANDSSSESNKEE